MIDFDRYLRELAEAFEEHGCRPCAADHAEAAVSLLFLIRMLVDEGAISETTAKTYRRELSRAALRYLATSL